MQSVYALTYKGKVESLVSAPDYERACKYFHVGKFDGMVKKMPDRREGWTIEDADLYLFPLPLAPQA